jgi:hypothetical protein
MLNDGDDENRVIRSGLKFIRKCQATDGSFPVFYTQDARDFSKAIKIKSIFSTAIILQMLAELKQFEETKKIIKPAIKFLLKQKSQYWTWNYWKRDSKDYKKRPYPDDLDDTFGALTAVSLSNAGIIDGETMARIVEVLTSLEVAEGGPYRTWLVSEKADAAWRDVDIAVNSNIGYFLHLQGIELPEINKLIDRAIKEEKLNSPYYPSKYPIMYLFSRFYKVKPDEDLIKMIFQERQADGGWGNPTDTALVLMTLANWEIDREILLPGKNYLLKKQNNGRWKTGPFYMGVSLSKDKGSYAGSPALTTAICMAALEKLNVKQEKTDSYPEKLNEEIVRKTKDIFRPAGKEFFREMERCLEPVMSGNDKNKITLLPYYFRNSLTKCGENISDELIEKLGIFNLLGWLVYTIADDFLDEEGSPQQIPIACLGMRELQKLGEELLPGNKEFENIYSRIMKEIDMANHWETTHCRLKIKNGNIDLKKYRLPEWGNMENISQRSMGHALGPCAILASLGYKADATEMRRVMDFFSGYIIAKQMNDDAHDWEDDLKCGRITPAVTMILKEFPEVHGNIKVLMPELQKYFWEKEIDRICRIIFGQVETARKALKEIECIEQKQIWEELLARQERSAREALEERDKTKAFLKEYKGK